MKVLMKNNQNKNRYRKESHERKKEHHIRHTGNLHAGAKE